MAQWQRTLYMADVWDSCDIPLVAREATKRLEALAPFSDEDVEFEKQDLIDELRSLAEDPLADNHDFDEVWARVYDWADTPLDNEWNGKKVCWVKTQ